VILEMITRRQRDTTTAISRRRENSIAITREVLDRLVQDICRDEAIEGWGRDSSFRERQS
jgi:hypothetical protein